ncbi:hypothetical protein Hanom_Chr15g01366361 [Helianthus anomalus]
MLMKILRPIRLTVVLRRKLKASVISSVSLLRLDRKRTNGYLHISRKLAFLV